MDGRLVGISRAITDYHYCTYLSDLAVDEAYQRRGIGKELIRRTHKAAGLQTHLILLAAPRARGYYPHIGMTGHDSCWMIPGVPKTLVVSENGWSNARRHAIILVQETVESVRSDEIPRGKRGPT